MSENTFITDKEYIRGVIRKTNVSHDHLDEGMPSLQFLDPMENIYVEFWNNFRANGGKILRCHNREDRLKYLKKLADDQRYNVVLNTHNNLCSDLEYAEMNYINAISANMTIDAVVALSTTLVARTGSIGFTQPVARFISMRNIARDVIVISRMNDIVPDFESALKRNLKFTKDIEAGIEFVTPTILPKVDGQEVRTPQNPRYVLLLLDEMKSQNA